MAKPKGTGEPWGDYGKEVLRQSRSKEVKTSRNERLVADLLKGGVTQAEVARRLGLSRQRVGQLKKSVTEKGLI